MKHLDKKQWIAVAVSLSLLTYIFFSGYIMDIFNPVTMTQNEQASQSSGVRIEDVVVGTGESVESGDTLTVHYVGTLPNGQVFDSSVGKNPITFTLGAGQVIRGWDEGFGGMKVGGKRILVISPEYAYGEQAIGSIPANSTLTFEVELVDVEK